VAKHKVTVRDKRDGKASKYTACPLCKHLIASKGLKKHIRTHLKPFGCPTCGMRFAAERSMVAHAINAHQCRVDDVSEVNKAARSLLSCDLCTKVFSTRGHLENHMRSHDGEKRFRCHLCEGGFSSRGNLVAHLRIHLGTQKRFACEFEGCDRRFSHPSEVKQHESVHTGQQSELYNNLLC
jgi:KRAB domain-containing zinc finger protein